MKTNKITTEEIAMSTIKKIMLSSVLASLTMGLALPSYADNSNKQDNNVTYNNLTNNFSSDTTKKDLAAATAPNPWAAIVALGAGMGPKYPGSDKMMGTGALALSLSYKNRFFISSAQGIGVNFINTAPFTVGASVNYSYGNNFRSKQYSGLNDPTDTFVGSVFANYTVNLFNFALTAYKTIGQLEGAGYYQAAVTRAVPLTKRLVLNFAVTGQYDEARYMQSLYGVTTTESSASGLPTYNTSNGWDNISYSITPMYNINKHWILTGTVAGISYLNQVTNSSLIAHAQNYAVMLGVIYNVF